MPRESLRHHCARQVQRLVSQPLVPDLTNEEVEDLVKTLKLTGILISKVLERVRTASAPRGLFIVGVQQGVSNVPDFSHDTRGVAIAGWFEQPQSGAERLFQQVRQRVLIPRIGAEDDAKES